MKRFLLGVVVICLAAWLVGCGASASSSTAFTGFLHRSERVLGPIVSRGPKASDVWIGSNGGGLRRMGEAVEALPLTPDYFGAGSRTYEVKLAATVRGWAATPTDEENGVAPVGEALEQRTVRMLAGLMVDWPLQADLAGAVGEALRQQPGVVESGAVDPDGRPAIRLRRRLDAIVGRDVPDPKTGELNTVHVADAVEHDVYLDPDTLGMLAEKETVVVASARSSFLRVGAVRAMAVFGPTTELPVLPEDLPRTQVAVIGWSLAGLRYPGRVRASGRTASVRRS